MSQDGDTKKGGVSSLNFIHRYLKQFDRETLSEFFGTFFLVLIGCGVNTQLYLAGEKGGNIIAGGFGWGLGLYIGILVSRVSGSHLNPAVTVSQAMYRGFPREKIQGYVQAQFLGAFCGAFIVFLNYVEAIHEKTNGIYAVPPDSNASAQVFGTFPQPNVSFLICLINEIVGTSILIICQIAMSDKTNHIVSEQWVALSNGFILMVIQITFGYNTGAAVNPARDFAPRLMSSLFAYGPKVFMTYSNYFLIPLMGPMVAAFGGPYLYQLIVETVQEKRPKRRITNNKRPESESSDDQENNNENDQHADKINQDNNISQKLLDNSNKQQ